jgi:hypothetical protein
MAFIEKKDPVVIDIKLTSKGRELLSQGKLNFKYYAIGDSEIDYAYTDAVNTVSTGYTAFDTNILKPVDKNPHILSFIPRNLSGDPYNVISSIPVTSYSVENHVDSIGFFTNSGNTFIIDSNHVKQPDAMVQVNQVQGGLTLKLYKSPKYGTSGNEPKAGDLLFIKWTHYNNTTGYSVNKNYPTPNLWYKITDVYSGSLASSGGVSIGVDRELPDFSTFGLSSTVKAGAMIYYNTINYSGNTIANMSSTEYLDESVLSFLQNSQCPTIVFPFWNMSIIFTEEIAGVKAANLKYTQFKNKAFGSFVSYIQQQSPFYKKLGVIHYTNSSPANVYGEGFLLDSPVLEIPTIMWHKSTKTKMGLTLIPYSAYGNPMYLIADKIVNHGLQTPYYYLIDINDTSSTPYSVGKVFPELKIFVIEDQELLFAMSYKSNRNWTLPNYTINT